MSPWHGRQPWRRRLRQVAAPSALHGMRAVQASCVWCAPRHRATASRACCTLTHAGCPAVGVWALWRLWKKRAATKWSRARPNAHMRTAGACPTSLSFGRPNVLPPDAMCVRAHAVAQARLGEHAGVRRSLRDLAARLRWCCAHPPARMHFRPPARSCLLARRCRGPIEANTPPPFSPETHSVALRDRIRTKPIRLLTRVAHAPLSPPPHHPTPPPRHTYATDTTITHALHRRGVARGGGGARGAGNAGGAPQAGQAGFFREQ